MNPFNRLILILTLFLVGCTATVPVRMGFPQPPNALIQPAEELSPLAADQKQFSDLLSNANDNYGKYYELQMKYNGWIEWYEVQKKIFEEIK